MCSISKRHAWFCSIISQTELEKSIRYLIFDAQDKFSEKSKQELLLKNVILSFLLIEIREKTMQQLQFKTRCPSQYMQKLQITRTQELLLKNVILSFLFGMSKSIEIREKTTQKQKFQTRCPSQSFPKYANISLTYLFRMSKLTEIFDAIVRYLNHHAQVNLKKLLTTQIGQSVLKNVILRF